MPYNKKKEKLIKGTYSGKKWRFKRPGAGVLFYKSRRMESKKNLTAVGKLLSTEERGSIWGGTESLWKGGGRTKEIKAWQGKTNL